MIITMIVALETSERLGMLLKYKGSEPLAGLLVRYYAYRIPVLVAMVAPIITLSGGITALVRLARQNELMAMQASGVSLKRIAIPLLAGGTFAAGLAFWVQEGLVPASAQKMQRITIKLSDTGAEDASLYKDLFAVSTGPSGQVTQWLHVGELDYQQKVIRNAQAYFPGEREPMMIDRGEWRNKRWYVTGRQIVRTADDSLSYAAFDDYPLDMHLTPEDMTERAAVDIAYRHLGELRRLAGQFPSRGAQLNTEIYKRLAYPFLNILLLLLVIPLVVEPGGQTSMKGIGLAVGVTLAFYVVMWAMLDFGYRGLLAPIAAAWLPVAVFTVIGLWMYSRSHV